MQMEFDLTPTLSVAELNEYVRRLLAGDVLLRSVNVTGEISGYKHHISGHRYFSLKDDSARVQCVMFRQNGMSLRFEPADGMRVSVTASASIYPRDGSYQLYVSSMERLGVGELYRRFEALKQKLSAEGLFDPAIKQIIPAMPRCIGIATSRTGAALRDMVRIAKRRNPNVAIIVAPCSVQGAAAAGEIVEAIQRLNADPRPEVILCGRGGGSIEDLWAFNEERVARAIASSRLPVISCVGHETDFTIADFVADMRAATPSMAAEIAVPVLSDLRADLQTAVQRLRAALVNGNRLRRAELNRICTRPALSEPERLLLTARRERVSKLWQRIETAEITRLASLRSRLDRSSAKLEALDPGGVLRRGYAYVSDDTGILSCIEGFHAGASVTIHMHDGTATAQLLRRRAKPKSRQDKSNNAAKPAETIKGSD